MARRKLLSREEYLASVPKKRISGGVLLLNETKDALLMVKPWYKDWWTIPGGVADAKESPRSAAIREVREEVGLSIETVAFVGIGHVARDADDVIHTFFYGGIVDGTMQKQIRIDEDEIDGWKFVPLDELEQYGKHQGFSVHMRELAKAGLSGRPYYFQEREEW